MKYEPILFFRLFMLVIDGTLVVLSFWLAFYWGKGKDPIIHGLFVYFFVKAVVSVCITISDLLVISMIPFWHTPMPFPPGLIYRLPLACAAAYLIYSIQKAKKGNNGAGKNIRQ